MGVIDQAAGLRATFEAKRAWWGAEPRALVWQPAPPASGDAAAARRFAQGIILFDGEMIQIAPGEAPWSAPLPSQHFTDLLHGHGWLDDFAASNHKLSRTALIGWARDWIARYGQGSGPGWKPELAARRLIRWIAHATEILSGADSELNHAFFRTLSAHTRFLDRRWRHTRPGIERVEALAGQVYARLSLERGMPADEAIRLLGQTADGMVDAEGGIASRNPQEVLRLVEILGWSAGIIEAADKIPDPGQTAALSRLVPVLRALTHADGRLARFHGGRAGQVAPIAEALDLAARYVRPGPTDHAMGYLRLAAGDATLLLDAADPPAAASAAEAHASALAIEFTHGAHPIIVNAGSGKGFGAGALSGSIGCHSTLVIGAGDQGPETLRGRVSASLTETEAGFWALGESAIWQDSHGLLHERRLKLSSEGNGVSGEDTLVSQGHADRARLASVFPEEFGPRRFRAVFLIHPEARVAPALNGRAALIVVPDGAKWMLRTDSQTVSIEAAQYFEAGRVHPRATKQVVVGGEILGYWGRITWSLDRLAAGNSA